MTNNSRNSRIKTVRAPSLDSQYVEMLVVSGLEIVDQVVSAYGEKYWICKPSTTSGNHIRGYKISWVTSDRRVHCTDAPILQLVLKNNRWQVHAVDAVGDMAPADFVNDFDNPSDAVNDIIQFFLGEPSRMAQKEACIKNLD